jgi:hypothetical protein
MACFAAAVSEPHPQWPEIAAFPIPFLTSPQVAGMVLQCGLDLVNVSWTHSAIVGPDSFTIWDGPDWSDLAVLQVVSTCLQQAGPYT